MGRSTLVPAEVGESAAEDDDWWFWSILIDRFAFSFKFNILIKVRVRNQNYFPAQVHPISRVDLAICAISTSLTMKIK